MSKAPLPRILQFRRHLLGVELRQLRNYADALERLLADEGGRLRARIEAEHAPVDDEFATSYEEHLFEELYPLEATFPRILRYSLFVHGYSVFEHGLLLLAEQYRVGFELHLHPSDLKGGGITQASTYIKKAAGAPFPDTSTHWADIRVLQEMRNLIVHKNGACPKADGRRAKIEALAAQWNGAFCIDATEHLELSAQFTDRFLDTLAAFVKELFAALGAGV